MKLRKLLILSFIILYPALTYAALVHPGTSNGLVGCWRFDEGRGTTAEDCSGHGNMGTLSGTTKPTWVAGKHGGALSFDGSASYVDVGTAIQPTTAITLSAWVYLTSAGSYSSIVCNAPSFAEANIKYCLYLDAATRKVKFGMGGTFIASSLVVPLNTWTFVAVTRTGNTAIAYMNAVNANINGAYATPTYSFSTTTIGEFDLLAGVHGAFPGKIDDVRIYSRALSAAEVQTLYKSGEAVINKIPVVRLNKGLVGYWPFDGNTIVNNVADLSGNGNNGLLQPTNATSSMKVAGKIGQGFRFDGTDYVGVGNPLSLQLAGSLSICLWSFNKLSPVAGTFYVSKSNGSTWDYGFFDDGSDYLRLYSGATSVTSNPKTISHNIWQHLCVTDNAGTVTFYINGIGTPGSASLAIANNNKTLSIGRDGSNTSATYYMNGSLDDVRIYSRALNPSEINALYKMGQVTINKTPVNRLTQGLVGYWTFDGKNITNGRINDVSGNGNNGFPTNISTSTFYTAGKIGQGARFDGVNNFVNAGNGSTLNFGNSSVSFSAWIRPGKINDSEPVFDKSIQTACDTAGAGWTIRVRSGSQNIEACRGNGGAGPTRLQLGPLKLNAWNFFTYTYDISTGIAKAYFNGSYVNQTAYSGTYTDSYNMLIGKNSNAFFNGVIDDVRIYNRALSPGEVKQLYNMGK